MTKIHTTLSIDNDLLKRAKELQLNISGEFNEFLRHRVVPKKTDLPENVLVIKCSQCRKEIEEGFLCVERNLVLCSECQENFKMSGCPHDKRGEHMHIKFPGHNEQNEEYTKRAEKITTDAQNNSS